MNTRCALGLALAAALAPPASGYVITSDLQPAFAGVGVPATMVEGRTTLPTCGTTANPYAQQFTVGNPALLTVRDGSHEPGWYICAGSPPAWVRISGDAATLPEGSGASDARKIARLAGDGTTWGLEPLSVGTAEIADDSITEGELEGGIRDQLERIPDDGYVEAAVGSDGSLAITTKNASGAEGTANIPIMSAAERSKLTGIAEGAQVNVKPDWEAIDGDADEILNKPSVADTDGDWLSGSRRVGDFTAANNNGVSWHDSGHDIPNSAVRLSFNGGAVSIDAAALRALPDGTVNTAVQPNQRIAVASSEHGGDDIYFGHNGNRLLISWENVTGFAVSDITAQIRRLERFADRDYPAERVAKTRLPVDNVYVGDLPENVTQAEAEAGTEQTNRAWSPRRVAQAIAALASGTGTGEANPAAATQAEAEAGTETGLRSWSPQRVWQAIKALANRVLAALGVLPAVGDHEVGDIVNLGGVLYELVPGTVDPHIYRGTLAARTGDFVGDDVFNWDDATDAINAFLSKAVLGSSPPATLWVEVHSGGYYAETELSRNSGSDTNDDYAYNRTSTEAALETDTVHVGDPFDVSFYSDEGKQTAVRVQSASANRWERDDRDDSAVNPIALLGNVVRWAKSKLPSDTLYTDSDLPDAMILDAAKSPRTSADRGRFLGTAKDDENALALLTRPEIPRGTAYPTNPDIGDEFILLHAVDFPQPRRFAVRQADADRRDIQLGGSGVVAIVAYSSTYTGANQAELRDKVFLQYAGSVPTEQQRYNVLQLGRDRYAPTNYAAATTAVGGGLQHLFEVSGIDYDAFTGNWWVDLERPQGGDKFPARQQEAGHYIYDAQDEWILAPGVAAPWATQGQPEPRTLLAITSLHDGVATGLSVPDPQTATRTPSAPILFAPAFDLDDDDHRTGIVQVEAVLSIATPAAPSNASFTSIANNSDAVRSIGRAVFTFASTLRDGAAYAAGAENGVQVGADIPVYLGATHLGNVKLFVTKNGDNALGYYMTWENVGAGSTALSFGLSLAGVFLHQDGPAQAATSKTMFADVYRPSAAINLPVTNAQPGAVYVPEWTAWTTVVQSAAITAAQAGDVNLLASFECEVFNPAPAGGGDRLMSEFRIARTRGGADTVLIDKIVYGPRNLGNAPAEFNTVSRFASGSAGWADVAQAGDTYKVEGRVISQNPSRSARCPAGANGLVVVGMDATSAAAGISFHNKDIAIAAAAGAGTGNQTNRKRLNAPGGGAPEANDGAVVLVDWGGITLVADSTAVGGITANAGHIAFAEAGNVWVEGSFAFDPDQGGQRARIVNHVRGVLTRGASVTRPAYLHSSTGYNKTSAVANALVQGPERQHLTFSWLLEVESGDQLAFEWQMYAQVNRVVDIIAASSVIKVRIAN